MRARAGDPLRGVSVLCRQVLRHRQRERERAAALQRPVDHEQPRAPGQTVLAGQLVRQAVQAHAQRGILRHERRFSAQALGQRQDLRPSRARRIVIVEQHRDVVRGGPRRLLRVAAAEAHG
jgi:hypothetical protein